MNHAVIFGLLAAIGWGVGPVLAKRAYTSKGKPIHAVTVQTVMGVIVLWSITLSVHGVTPIQASSISTIWPFIAGGVIGSGIARYALYWGIDNIGASITSAVAASDPVFGVVIAAIALTEIPTPLQVLGVVLSMTGVVVVSFSDGGNRTGWRTRLVSIPLIAACLYGVAAVLRRYAFGISDTPVFFAVAVSETSALIVVLCAILLRFRQQLTSVQLNSYKYLIASGVSYTLGTASIFASLNAGPVVIGSTLGSTAALINVGVVSVFLQDVERVPIQTIIGTAIGVCGIILIAV